ncbi:hypothetical protein F5148DRAFT_1198870 [Russula earlei]|uniref:Uncharacterized protein n=1 Tax=Russula earlei TaxID=71964 RepID=A0ACC0U9H5_9AGAM|nr:hypothetical protein F5148DRAFT_1198870 [Russula earlei]
MPSLETVPLENVAVLAKFARKYQVDALEKRITQNLKDNMELDPIGVYSIAIAYGYKDVGITAARSCLRLPISCLRSQCEQYVTIQHISELFDYHIACGEAASEIAVSGRTWLSSFLKNGTLARGNSSYNCVSCNSRGVDPDQTPNSSMSTNMSLTTLTQARQEGEMDHCGCGNTYIIPPSYLQGVRLQKQSQRKIFY